MSKKSYKINIDNAEKAWENFSSELGKYVEGDMRNGKAKGMGFEVSYQTNDDGELTIDLLKKPMLVPESMFWSQVETNMKKHNIVD